MPATTTTASLDGAFRGVPEGVGADKSKLPAPAVLGRRTRFFLASHPKRWRHVLERDDDRKITASHWEPELAICQKKVGTNGVRSNPDGSNINSLAYEAGMMKKGFTIIQPRDMTRPEPFQELVLRQELRDGGNYFLLPWEGLTTVFGETQRITDYAVYRKFLDWSLESGTIAPMHRAMLDRKVRALDEELNRVLGARKSEGSTEKVAELRDVRARMLSDWSKQFDKKAGK